MNNTHIRVICLIMLSTGLTLVASAPKDLQAIHDAYQQYSLACKKARTTLLLTDVKHLPAPFIDLIVRLLSDEKLVKLNVGKIKQSFQDYKGFSCDKTGFFRAFYLEPTSSELGTCTIQFLDYRPYTTCRGLYSPMSAEDKVHIAENDGSSDILLKRIFETYDYNADEILQKLDTIVTQELLEKPVRIKTETDACRKQFGNIVPASSQTLAKRCIIDTQRAIKERSELFYQLRAVDHNLIKGLALPSEQHILAVAKAAEKAVDDVHHGHLVTDAGSGLEFYAIVPVFNPEEQKEMHPVAQTTTSVPQAAPPYHVRTGVLTAMMLPAAYIMTKLATALAAKKGK